jgi:hypothetical protein
MDTKEIEYKEENFSISWDEKEKIISVKAWSIHKKETAELFKDRFAKILESISDKGDINILVDDTENIKTDHEARRIYTSFTKDLVDKYSDINVKMAIFGANTFVSMVVNFLVVPIANKKNVIIKSFKTREESIKWFKENNY